MTMIPHNWTPRAYQRPFLEAIATPNRTVRRADCCWHRRAGKDVTALNATIACAVLDRPGLYYHLLPTAKQGRKVIWEGMDRTGRPYLDYWPPECVVGAKQDDMSLRVRGRQGESLWQVVGTDRESIDRLVGTNPVGAVFSEWSLHDAKAWELLRPIMAENGGWAAFLYTPRGRNHAYRQWIMAQANPDWLQQTLTVSDTGAITLDMIDAERKAGMSEEMIQQEFFCSFNAPQFGAYYGAEMMAARQEGRIKDFKPDKNLLTHTAWDLGYNDDMSIWWFQVAGREVHVLHYYESNNEAMSHYVRVLNAVKEADDLIYGTHWAPHDIEVGEFSTGKTRKQTAKALGIKFSVVPKTASLADDIEGVRQILPRCWFRAPETDIGVGHLEAYRKEYDEKHEIFREHPLHDSHSHGADAFRTLNGALRLGAGQAHDGPSDTELIMLDEMYRSL